MVFSKNRFESEDAPEQAQTETYADALKRHDDEQARFVAAKVDAYEQERKRKPPTEFKPPADAIEVVTYRDFKIYVAQNPYQHAPDNAVTYRALAFRQQDGKSLVTGHPQPLARYNPETAREWPSAKEALKAICGMIDRTAPLPRYDVAVPDYEGFKLVVSMVPPPETRPGEASAHTQLYVGRATKDGLVIDEEGRYSQQVINQLRIRIDRYVAFGLVPRGSESE